MIENVHSMLDLNSEILNVRFARLHLRRIATVCEVLWRENDTMDDRRSRVDCIIDKCDSDMTYYWL